MDVNDSVASIYAGLSIVFLAILGVLILWVTRAGAKGSLKRNGWVGVRTRSTMASDVGWVAGHRAATPVSIAIALLVFVADVVLAAAIVRNWSTAAVTVVSLGSVAAMLLLLGLAAVKAEHAAKNVGQHD